MAYDSSLNSNAALRLALPHLFDLDTIGGYCRLMLAENTFRNERIVEQSLKKFGGETSVFSVNWYASQLRKLGFQVARNDKRDW